MEVRIGVVGRIVGGSDVGKFIQVVDDEQATGGYLVLISDAPEMDDCFDFWVADRRELLEVFDQSDREIEWS